MNRVLIAWELGSGLGHVGRLRAISVELIRRGKLVAIASRNVRLCRQAFEGTGVTIIRAPVVPPSEKRLKLPCTYSDILFDCGYSSAENVTGAVAEWLELMDGYDPELLLVDHSPTALLASRIRGQVAVVAGTGFVCPPDLSPLPSLRKEIPAPHWAAEIERTVLRSMNAALSARGGMELSRVTHLFGPPGSRYLITLPLLDHYGKWRESENRGSRYWPPFGTLPGQTITWPAPPMNRRVFVYLRGEPSLVSLLQGMAYMRVSTICCAPHMPVEERALFAGTSVFVASSPVDLRTIVGDCDAAILHGGHGTVCEFLRAGVPMLVLPLSLEQQVTGDRLVELGVGVQATTGDPMEIGLALQQLLEDPSFRERAQTHAKHHPEIAEEAAVGQFLDAIVMET